MRKVLLASLLSCVLLVVANANAKSSGKGTTGKYQGTITSVMRNAVVIDVGTDKPKRIEVTVDDKTSITGYGKKGTIADLARGQIVSVDVSNNHAKSIDVTGVANSGS
jgi:hypothetical protein